MRVFQGARRLSALACVVGLAAPVCARAAEPVPIAVFSFELQDTSGEGPRPGQRERLSLATRTLEDMLAATGKYREVDLAPYAAEVKATEPRYSCTDCWADVARKAGATVAVVPYVHKVSTLISAMSISIVDLTKMTYIARIEGQIRGDTDEAYVRGVRFLVEDRFLRGAP
jgi:hypothetical protein